MDTRQLEYILTIAEERSISRAAEKLFLSQSALSQHLAKLKAEGLPPLFYRQKGEMLLTDAGKIYVNGARIILKLNSDAIESMRSMEERQIGSLRLAVSRRLQPLVYRKLLPWLRRTYPTVEVSVTTSVGLQMRRAIEDGAVDIGVFSSIREENEIMDYTVLRREELVDLFPPERQDGLPVLLPSAGTHLRLICDHAFREAGRTVKTYAEADDMDVILQLVRQGECSAVLARGDLADPGFVVEPFSPPVHFYTVAATRHNSDSPMARAVIDMLQATLSCHPKPAGAPAQ